jgi:hypothetical protein
MGVDSKNLPPWVKAIEAPIPKSDIAINMEPLKDIAVI